MVNINRSQMKFTEDKLGKASGALLSNENNPHFHADSITRARTTKLTF